MKLGYFIRQTSREAVIEGVKNVKRYHIPDEQIISLRNPLVTNGINALKRHANVNKSYTINQAKINTFLAASSLSHLLDGWMYLSNAFNALLNGDKGGAIHLSYYAELRSAMSILATEGVGVFDQKHIGVFSPSTNCEFPKNYFKGTPPSVSYKQPPSPTHIFTWDAMEKWANSAYKPSPEILRIFRIRGFDFIELTEFFHPRATPVLSVKIVKQWLKDWCFDIKSYRNDRANRNEVSYRPQRIKEFDKPVDFNSIITDLTLFWEALSPSQRDRFMLLDTYLLRKLFRTLYDKLSPRQTYEELVVNAFEQRGLHDQTLINLLSFTEPYQNDHLIFRHARVDELTPLSIMARATLLLRIAVGMVSQLYRSGDVAKNELGFVWNSYGIDSGFWPTGSIPNDFDVLWTDVQTPISDIKDDIVNNSTTNDLFSIRLRNNSRMAFLPQINRACLWGLDF
jgi:hypothetical protein